MKCLGPFGVAKCADRFDPIVIATAIARDVLVDEGRCISTNGIAYRADKVRDN